MRKPSPSSKMHGPFEVTSVEPHNDYRLRTTKETLTAYQDYLQNVIRPINEVND